MIDQRTCNIYFSIIYVGTSAIKHFIHIRVPVDLVQYSSLVIGMARLYKHPVITHWRRYAVSVVVNVSISGNQNWETFYTIGKLCQVFLFCVPNLVEMFIGYLENLKKTLFQIS